jgi:probable HAF family extracellular repeat protein
MQDLGTLGGNHSWAFGVSADGSVVVGRSDTADGFGRAFRWTAQGGMQNIDTIGGLSSVSVSVSANGNVVVGWARNRDQNRRAFRWTAATGMQELGTLGGNESHAYGVSADGNIVVGWASDANGRAHAFRWTASRGMEDLNRVYSQLLTDGSELWSAEAISPDGRYIVGNGYNAATRRMEAFLLDTKPAGDVTNDGCVNDTDLLTVLFNFGRER